MQSLNLTVRERLESFAEVYIARKIVSSMAFEVNFNIDVKLGLAIKLRVSKV